MLLLRFEPSFSYEYLMVLPHELGTHFLVNLTLFHLRIVAREIWENEQLCQIHSRLVRAREWVFLRFFNGVVTVLNR